MSRYLYVVRHAEAIARGTLEPDEDRWLTERGRRRFRRLARRFARQERKAPIEAVLSSPLPRAVMTAELLLAALGLCGPLEICAGLAPEAPLEAACALACGQRRVVAVVGHEPMLSALLAELLGGAPAEAKDGLRKGAIAAVRLAKRPGDGDGTRLRYLLSP